MNILITNDDGMEAAQLIPLIRRCRELGNVTVVVPKTEQSAKSHSIEIRKPFEIRQVQLAEDITVWSVDSAPADCVRFACSYLDTEFDLCISGINRGYNLGQDIPYSGTVAAATEAANKGMKALALSTSIKFYDRAVDCLDSVFAYIEDNRLLETHSFYNINIPVDPKGFRITRQGGRSFCEEFTPIGDNLFAPTGIPKVSNGSDPAQDRDAVFLGYISVTPMTAERTAMRVFEELHRE